MSDVLHKATVLVLNRNWQAIDVKTPADAFCMMAAGTATALDIAGGENMEPCNGTSGSRFRCATATTASARSTARCACPRCIVLARYDKVPKRRPKLSTRGIWERDGGVCQYTGKKLAREEGNIDHVLPRSRGGKTTLGKLRAGRQAINSRKGSRTPEELGLKLAKMPAAPREMPSSYFIRNTHGVRDWEMFLG